MKFEDLNNELLHSHLNRDRQGISKYGGGRLTSGKVSPLPSQPFELAQLFQQLISRKVNALQTCTALQLICFCDEEIRGMLEEGFPWNGGVKITPVCFALLRMEQAA